MPEESQNDDATQNDNLDPDEGATSGDGAAKDPIKTGKTDHGATEEPGDSAAEEIGEVTGADAGTTPGEAGIRAESGAAEPHGQAADADDDSVGDVVDDAPDDAGDDVAESGRSAEPDTYEPGSSDDGPAETGAAADRESGPGETEFGIAGWAGAPDDDTLPDSHVLAGATEAHEAADSPAGEDDDAVTPDDTTRLDLSPLDDARETGPPPESSPESRPETPADATKPYLIPAEDSAGDRPDDTRADEPASVTIADELPSAAATKATAPARRPASAGGGRGAPPGRGPGAARSRRLKYARRACYVLGALILLPIIAFVVVYLMTPVPSTAQPAAKAQQSVFYYSDGKTVIARSGDFDRRPVPLAEVPPQVRDAVISAENRSFYSDSGVSVKGSVRAMWATLTGGSTQGGSTITQQMVRNYYSGLSQERTAGRKLKEIMIALKVGREKDKDWILQQYLNTIYFGRDAYGIESAAQAYYHKDVKDLTPAEGAFLAAAIQLPSYAADLSKDGARAYMQARWKYVVDGMVQMKTISPQQAAAMKFPEPMKQRQKSIYAGSKGYMVSQAKAELRRMRYTDNQINMGGLKVRTTFNKDLMAAAKQAVESNIPAGTSKKVMTGLLSIDPSNGEVVAFYGGKDYVDQQFNNAFDARVQAGSGFKPYVLAAALDDGETLNTYVDGSSPQTFAGTAIQNDEGESFGMVNLVTATQDSINTAYINLGQKVGLGNVVSTAEKFGIPAKQLEPHKDAPTLPLGVADVTVEQQAAGYATFAAEGVYHTPHVIKSVTDQDGKTRKVTEKGRKVVPENVAHDATYAMQKVVDSGTGVNASLPDRNAAGKTGTTSDGKQIWFNGFIPQLATSVGIFRSDNKALTIPGYSAYGGDLPAKIWRTYTEEADKNIPVKNFAPPTTYTGGGYGRSTSGPVVHPRPSHTRPGTRPTLPPAEPTEPPTNDGPGGPDGPPATEPTGRPTAGTLRHHSTEFRDTPG